MSLERLSPPAKEDAAGARATCATVVVVDDETDVRRSLSRLLRAAGYTVKTFATPQDFLEDPLPAVPSCVVLDMCMDGMNGLQVQDELRGRARQMPVIFLSGRGTISAAAAGFKHGARDFLEKPVRARELLAAVSGAIESDRSHAAERAELDDIRARLDNLTPREQEVLRLVVSGRLNKQAAAELGISEKTIKVHRARVMEKMKVESLAALVLVAERMGLTPAPAALVTESLPTWIC